MKLHKLECIPHGAVEHKMPRTGMHFELDLNMNDDL